MKEKLYTIELMDAVKSGDECPGFVIWNGSWSRKPEFVLGSSYMESDIRDMTDKQGFCRKTYEDHVRLRQFPGKCLDFEKQNGVFEKTDEKGDGRIYTVQTVLFWKDEKVGVLRKWNHLLGQGAGKPLLCVRTGERDVPAHAGHLCLSCEKGP